MPTSQSTTSSEEARPSRPCRWSTTMGRRPLEQVEPAPNQVRREVSLGIAAGRYNGARYRQSRPQGDPKRRRGDDNGTGKQPGHLRPDRPLRLSDRLHGRLKEVEQRTRKDRERKGHHYPLSPTPFLAEEDANEVRRDGCRTQERREYDDCGQLGEPRVGACRGFASAKACECRKRSCLEGRHQRLHQKIQASRSDTKQTEGCGSSYNSDHEVGQTAVDLPHQPADHYLRTEGQQRTDLAWSEPQARPIVDEAPNDYCLHQ